MNNLQDSNKQNGMEISTNPETILQLAAIYVARDGIDGLEKLRKELKALKQKNALQELADQAQELDMGYGKQQEIAPNDSAVFYTWWRVLNDDLVESKKAMALAFKAYQEGLRQARKMAFHNIEPVYYSVTINGEHCSNLFMNKNDALDTKNRLDRIDALARKFGGEMKDKREIVPLYELPPLTN